MRYLIGNWKSNKTFEETYQWFDQFSKIYDPVIDLTTVLAVPFPFLQEASKKKHELNLQHFALAAQDISPYPFGAYTGAVSANMLKHQIEYCIVGHSERRQYFAESHLEIANKVELLLTSEITPILCLDQPYAQKQLAAFDQKDLEKLIIAYEPLEAIGTGEPADPKQVAEVVKRIRELIQTDQTPIIYGGSTNADNARTYLEIEGVAGLLPGSSSLNPDVFSRMVHAYT